MKRRPAGALARASSGATLLELVLYIGGAALALIGILALLTLLSQSWVRGRAQAVVEEGIRFGIERIRAEVEASQSVLVPAPGSSGPALELSTGATQEAYSGFAWAGGGSSSDSPLSGTTPGGLGWISLNCTGQADPWDCDQPDNALDNYRVTRSLSVLSGFALACPGTPPATCSVPSGISFNCQSSPESDPCVKADYRVTVDAAGDYHGWAWGEETGWISFNCADRNWCATIDYKVSETKTATGAEIHGWAWSENYGWISFNCAEPGLCDSGEPNYKVTVGLSAGRTQFDVSGGALRITVGGGAPQNLTDATNVEICPCGSVNCVGGDPYFTVIANPAPARPVVQTCFRATYRGLGSALTQYSTEIRSTFQLR